MKSDPSSFSLNSQYDLSSDPGLQPNQVSGAVAVVQSGFHTAAALVAQLKLKDRKRRTGDAAKEKQLQESLQAGHTLIAQRYDAECKEFGDAFTKGDGMCVRSP